ncbi:hypothetical protein PCE1_003490 [Barthelona sp. PCE]
MAFADKYAISPAFSFNQDENKISIFDTINEGADKFLSHEEIEKALSQTKRASKSYKISETPKKNPKLYEGLGTDRELFLTQSPAVGVHNPNYNVNKMKSPRIKFGTSPARPIVKVEDHERIGPGDYEVQSTFIKKKAKNKIPKKQTRKQYISKNHEVENFGKNSPGPVYYPKNDGCFPPAPPVGYSPSMNMWRSRVVRKRKKKLEMKKKGKSLGEHLDKQIEQIERNIANPNEEPVPVETEFKEEETVEENMKDEIPLGAEAEKELVVEEKLPDDVVIVSSKELKEIVTSPRLLSVPSELDEKKETEKETVVADFDSVDEEEDMKHMEMTESEENISPKSDEEHVVIEEVTDMVESTEAVETIEVSRSEADEVEDETEKVEDETEKVEDETEKVEDETEKVEDETDKVEDETDKVEDETEKVEEKVEKELIKEVKTEPQTEKVAEVPKIALEKRPTSNGMITPRQSRRKHTLETPRTVNNRTPAEKPVMRTPRGYSIRGKNVQSERARFISPMHSLHEPASHKNKTPGPGQYKIRKDVNLKHSPTFSKVRRETGMVNKIEGDYRFYNIGSSLGAAGKRTPRKKKAYSPTPRRKGKNKKRQSSAIADVQKVSEKIDLKKPDLAELAFEMIEKEANLFSNTQPKM